MMYVKDGTCEICGATIPGADDLSFCSKACAIALQRKIVEGRES